MGNFIFFAYFSLSILLEKDVLVQNKKKEEELEDIIWNFISN